MAVAHEAQRRKMLSFLDIFLFLTNVFRTRFEKTAACCCL